MNICYDREFDYNFLTSENNAKVISFSSQTKGCPASNILSIDKKTIWLSENQIPQFVVVDFSNLIKKPKSHFKYFGIYCWHAYSTNPKSIELQFSKDNKNYLSFGKYEICLKPGTQFFEIKNNKLLEFQKFKYLKIILKETFGGNRTYLNQFYLFDELSGMNENVDKNSEYKFTQISEKKKIKSEEPSLFIEEDEELNAPVEMSRENKKVINNEESVYSDKEENIKFNSNLNSYRENKIKKIENILRNKSKKKEKLKFSREESDSEDENKIIRNKKRLNNSFGFERIIKKDSINRNFNPVNNNTNNEYTQLENQLKEMEDHLRSMEAETKVEDYNYNSNCLNYNYNNNYNENYNNNYKSSHGLIHSRSFSHLRPNYKENSTNSIYFNNSNNPFKENNINTFQNQNNNINLDNYINQTPTNYSPINPSQTNQNLPNTSFNSQQVYQCNMTLENKMQNIEDKLNKFDDELSQLKNSFGKLLENINKLVDQPSLLNRNNNSSFKNQNENNIPNNELLNIILNECSKMINEKLMASNNTFNNNLKNNLNNNLNHTSNNYSQSNHNNIQMTKRSKNPQNENNNNINSFEEKLNKKIEEKFESLATNIETQIYNNFLKPSISTIEKTMRTNFDDIKNKIQTINNDIINEDSNKHSVDFDIDSSFNELKINSLNKDKNLDSKLKEINKLGGRLYDKLLEKVNK